MMKRISIALSLAIWLALPAVATAAPLSGLKFEQQKQQIVKDVRKNCPASSGLADTIFANRVLESPENKVAVQSAARALDKNSDAAYQKAISGIQCPTQ
ncbi:MULTISPECIES: YicS family protein [unclassified Klebsiella]|uniref:YicS family protein n=1 Tax=unclassified Klebsiella TaxID=2608929 RepID=UPI001D1859C6|nr:MULTISPECIES: YicS family protein [unclassified Klebsiella]